MTGETILVVEDNLVNLKLAQVFLKKHGYNVLSATDANEALMILKDHKPKLILMDLQLPGIDGLQLTKLLKNNPQTKDIIIIALTAYAMKGDEEKAKVAGCVAYVTKPFDTRTLPDLIACFLNREFVNK
jgi:CheY-like chemotaxis protein